MNALKTTCDPRGQKMFESEPNKVGRETICKPAPFLFKSVENESERIAGQNKVSKLIKSSLKLLKLAKTW